MRTLGIAAACLLLLIAAGCWFVLSVSTKLKYDRVRVDFANSVYAVKPFDSEGEALRIDVETTWNRASDVTNGPSSQVTRLAGLTPSVSNLVYVFNYQMPEYRWLSPAKNRQAAMFGVLKAKFFPVSVDKAWHVSDDQHLAMLWCRTNTVYIYRDEANGMRETLFFKQRGDEPDGAADGSQPIRSETNLTSSAAGSLR